MATCWFWYGRRGTCSTSKAVIQISLKHAQSIPVAGRRTGSNYKNNLAIIATMNLAERPVAHTRTNLALPPRVVKSPFFTSPSDELFTHGPGIAGDSCACSDLP